MGAAEVLAALLLGAVLHAPLTAGQAEFDSVPGVQGTFSATLNATLFPIVPYSFSREVSNFVADWNVAVQWAGRTADINRYDLSAPRAFALIHLAQWQALRLNAVVEEPVEPNCLIAYVSHLVFNNLFSNYNVQADALLKAEVANFSAYERDTAQQFAGPVVVNLLASRLDDGSQQAGWSTPAPPGSAPGLFQDISNGTTPDLFSNYANGTGFLIQNMQTFPIFEQDEGPPAVGSPQYNSNYAGYSQYGVANTSNSIRTGYQTTSAFFWFETNGTSGASGHWNQIALTLMPANMTLYDTAALLARLNVAAWDAYVLITVGKYKFDRWRPITALRQGDCNGTQTVSCHLPVPGWTPLLRTPANPVYPSYPGGYAGVSETVLNNWIGGGYLNFSIGSESILPGNGLNPRPRTYQSVTQAALEVCSSRYYGGVEAPNDALAGKYYGNAVAEYVVEVFDQLDPLSPSALPQYTDLLKVYGIGDLVVATSEPAVAPSSP